MGCGGGVGGGGPAVLSDLGRAVWLLPATVRARGVRFGTHVDRACGGCGVFRHTRSGRRLATGSSPRHVCTAACFVPVRAECGVCHGSVLGGRDALPRVRRRVRGRNSGHSVRRQDRVRSGCGRGQPHGSALSRRCRHRRHGTTRKASGSSASWPVPDPAWARHVHCVGDAGAAAFHAGH